MNSEVRLVSFATAKEFVERWHYSHCIPKGKNICYGLYVEAELYAVIVYGNGVNPYQASFLEVENVFELKRMCRSEPKREEFPLTQFISKTLKLLQKDYKVDCVVAFADPEHGHEGGVYRAANFAKHGETQAEYHLIDKDGNIRHRRYAYRHSQRNGISIAESREILGVKRIKTLPKIRYVRYFGKFKYRNLN